MAELTTLRCVIVAFSASLHEPARVLLRSWSEATPFTLNVSPGDASRVQANVGRQADISMGISRDSAGVISGGEVLEFDEVPDRGPDDLAKLRAWFRESGAAEYWSKVENIEAELGRDDDE